MPQRSIKAGPCPSIDGPPTRTAKPVTTLLAAPDRMTMPEPVWPGMANPPRITESEA